MAGQSVAKLCFTNACFELCKSERGVPKRGKALNPL
jgi:hypothetical protein